MNRSDGILDYDKIIEFRDRKCTSFTSSRGEVVNFYGHYVVMPRIDELKKQDREKKKAAEVATWRTSASASEQRPFRTPVRPAT